jgi:hypothetical protein
VCFELAGYLLEELRDSKNVEMFKEDIESSNVFIGSLIFIEELAEKVCSRFLSVVSSSLLASGGPAPPPLVPP